MSILYRVAVRREEKQFVAESAAVVSRRVSGKKYVPVAQIRDSCDPVDHRQTRITFRGDSLHFAAAYDGPIKERFIWPFRNAAGCDTGISLHRFPVSDQTYLCSAEGFFPIKAERGPKGFRITVYSAATVPKKDALLHRILATAVQTESFDNGFAYCVQAAEPLPLAFLMAIISLPFTVFPVMRVSDFLTGGNG